METVKEVKGSAQEKFALDFERTSSNFKCSDQRYNCLYFAKLCRNKSQEMIHWRNLRWKRGRTGIERGSWQFQMPIWIQLREIWHEYYLVNLWWIQKLKELKRKTIMDFYPSTVNTIWLSFTDEWLYWILEAWKMIWNLKGLMNLIQETFTFTMQEEIWSEKEV